MTALAALLLTAGCGGGDSIGDRLLVSSGQLEVKPLTVEEALAAGWVDSGDCVPGMGRRLIKAAGDQPGSMSLLFDAAGNLIGTEVNSLTEQPSPPWEQLDQGQPGQDFLLWTLRQYYTDPADACEA